MGNFKNEEKAKELCGCCSGCTFSCKDRLNCKAEDKYNIAMKMAAWKDEQINLLLDAIDYAYLKTDGTYGDLAFVVADKVEYLKSLKQSNL